jgi:hypothetical protein
MEPKYVLIFDNNYYNNPFAIYEQMSTPQEDEYVPIKGSDMLMKQNRFPLISQRLHSRYDRIETALKALSSLNDGEPIILAYSTKTVDNTFTV